MRAVGLVLLLVGTIVAALLLTATPASAQQPQVIFAPDPNLQELDPGEQFTFTVTAPGYPGGVMGFYRLTLGPTMYESEFGMGGVPNAASVSITIDQSMLNGCITGSGYIRVQQQVVAWYPAISTMQTTYVPCSVLASPVIVSPTFNEVCGPNNDTLNFLAQESSVNPLPADSGWLNGQRTVTYSPNPGYAFRSGVITTFTFGDTVPCETEAPTPPTQVEVCGFDNDTITIPQPPTGVLVQDSGWTNGSRTITFSASEGYILPETTDISHSFTDSGPCLVKAVSPVKVAACGSNNDTFTFSEQPAGILPDPADSGWNENQRIFTYSASKGYAFANEQERIFQFTDDGPCITEVPVPPAVTKVCGPDNDVVLLAEDQPANVIVQSDGEWSGGVWTIVFGAEENYALPPEFVAEYRLVDDAEPCPTDAPVSPVQAAICGPNNDLITIPDQPSGVSADTDSGWMNGERTITFVVAPEFVTDGPSSFTFIDENVPCDVESDGTTVIVTLQTSDGGSISGSKYTLYEPVASQTVVGATREGLIGENNTVIFEGLVTGSYRFATSPSGYEPVDEVIVVDEQVETQQVTISVTALQATTTPTAEPIPSPTPSTTENSTPTPGATEDPTPTSAAAIAPDTGTHEPTPTVATVTALPRTGAGPGREQAMLVLGLAALCLGMVVLTSRRVSQR